MSEPRRWCLNCGEVLRDGQARHEHDVICSWRCALEKGREALDAASQRPIRTDLTIALDAIDSLVERYYALGLILYPAYTTLAGLTREFRKMQAEQFAGQP